MIVSISADVLTSSGLLLTISVVSVLSLEAYSISVCIWTVHKRFGQLGLEYVVL